MDKLTQKEIFEGRHYWQIIYERAVKVALPQGSGKLRSARLWLMLSSEVMAKELKISRSAYSQIEEREEAETISLKNLRSAAEAMECELIYEIRPKSGKSFAEIIWQKIYKIASKHAWLKNCDQKKRANALAAVARDLMNDPKFRRAQGWKTKRTATTEFTRL